MLVETYEVLEQHQADDGTFTPEDRELAESLIVDLDLEGQSRYMRRESSDATEIPAIPYRKMTAEEKEVYSLILPEKTLLQKYSDAPIPVRVLQVAAHARPMFDGLIVWHPTNADDPDPLLLGFNGHQYSPSEYFLLARWGDELLPFSELREKAARLLRERVIAKLKSIQEEVAMKLRVVDSLTPFQLLAGKDLKDPKFFP